jgi:hypothetical protein
MTPPFGRLGARALGLAVAANLVVSTAVAVAWHAAPSVSAHRGVAEAEDSAGPEDGYLFSRLSVGKTPTADDFRIVGQERAAVAAMTAKEAPGIAAAKWQFHGPTDIGGRIVDLALDPKHVGTVYAATAGGGLWKTTDSATFTSIWPASFVQALGAVAVAPDGTMYVGTGETNPGGGSITYGGDGVYRSTDGGRTWKNMGLRTSATIARIAIDPKDANRIYVAVSGNLYVPGGQRGLYVSDNRGQTWRQLLAAPNATTGASDVAVDPKDPRRIFVGMWDHTRQVDSRTYTGPGSGLWMTTDRGAHWTQLGPANGLLPNSTANGRVGVTIDARNHNNVYMIYANDPLGLFEAYFKSTDGGQTWTAPAGAQSDLADSQYVYGWWFAHLWVDPFNSNNVFIAGLDLYQSTDGGQSFSTSSGPHSDQHAMAFDPRVKGLVYLGDDGGFYRSTASGASNSWHKATYEPWTQFDGLDVSEQDPSRINGGLQDNGSVRSWGHGPAGNKDWDSYFGGDGQQNLINPKNKDNVFACYQYGSCAVSTDGGANMNEFDQQTVSDRHNYFTPMTFDPGNPATVYYAGDVVNKTTDGGNTWTPISPDLGLLDPGTELNPLYAAHYGTVTSMAVARGDANDIWAGTDNGHLWHTTSGGPAWTLISSSVLPARWISGVTIDTGNTKTVYVSYSGFRQGDRTPYLFRSTDDGATWHNITANLPEAPVNDLRVVNGRLYVATDVGVFTSSSGSIKWYLLGSGLPRVPVTHLRYIPKNHTLYASTFGRSVWSVRLT